MITRIEITYTIPDARAIGKYKQVHDMGIFIKDLQIVDVYTIDKKLTEEQLVKIAEMLANPVIQTFAISGRKDYPVIANRFDYVIEVGFLPGVTDNLANTAKESIEDLLKIRFVPGEGVYSSQMMYISGNVSFDSIEKIATSFANQLIQRISIKDNSEYQKNKGMDLVAPKVHLEKKIAVTEVDLAVSDEELVTIGMQGIADADGSRRGSLALDLIYMKTIQAYFKKLDRNPTDIELESLAQTWSEHCKHTIFNDPIDTIEKGLFKSYIKKATEEIRQKKGKDDFCVSVFHDNSGAIVLDDEYLITHKVETHNSPSALDPFGGAITGIVGVNRDALGFGLGAKPIINTYGFCVGDPDDVTPIYRDAAITQKMLSPKRILEGVVAGINAGGNCSGIPSPEGFLYVDDSYKGKPLVFAGTVGIIPRNVGVRDAVVKKAEPGDYIVMLGGRVGKDGIHGATFSSEALNSASSTASVQIGDPITQKKLSDVLVKEARDLNLYSSITDDGAGGLSCSVAEMARESGGCIVNLDTVPLKYPGLQPWQIWISESQERMTLAVPKEKWQIFKDLVDRRGVEATIIGEFTNSGNCIVQYGNEEIMNIEMAFLHDGLPQRKMNSKKISRISQELHVIKPSDYTSVMLKMLARKNIASYEFISSQYDYIVRAESVLGPLQGRGRINAEATAMRPLLHSKKAVVLSRGINPGYSEIDPYAMAAAAIDSSIRGAVASGANPDYIAILDNFCWCSANEPERLYQLKEAARACYETAVGYGTPFISGKDSMFNDFKGYDETGKAIKISALPTLLISAIGIVADANTLISLDSKFPGDLVYLLGETQDELGGSEYIAMNKQNGGQVPQVDVKKNKHMYECFYQATQKNLIASSQSVAKGGMLVALAKTAMGGMLGMDVSIEKMPGNYTSIVSSLFSESQGRIIVTVNPTNKQAFEAVMRDTACMQLGVITEKPMFVLKVNEHKPLITASVASMVDAYRDTYKDF